MSYEEAYNEVVKLYMPQLDVFLTTTVGYATSCMRTMLSSEEKQIMGGLARLHLQAKRYGGTTRSIHTYEKPELFGLELVVMSKRVCKTGEYFAPSSWRGDFTGEYDCEPGGLGDCKTHILLELDYYVSTVGLIGKDWQKFAGTWIEAKNVQKVNNSSQ
jgi:hypothetical protein